MLTVGPVSYTHLDVYKRQILLGHSSSSRARQLQTLRQATLSNTRNHLELIIPVSYTHLDVYKRQGLCLEPQPQVVWA